MKYAVDVALLIWKLQLKRMQISWLDVTVEIDKTSNARDTDISRSVSDERHIYSRHPRDPTLAFGKDDYEKKQGLWY